MVEQGDAQEKNMAEPLKSAIGLAQECWRRAEVEQDPFRKVLLEMAGNCLEDTMCLHGEAAEKAVWASLGNAVYGSPEIEHYKKQTPESVLLDLVIETVHPDDE